MTEQQISKAPMADVNPYKDRQVQAKMAAQRAAREERERLDEVQSKAIAEAEAQINSEIEAREAKALIGPAAGRGENRRLETPPAPVAADAWKHDTTLRYPKTDEEFAQLVAMACTDQNQIEVPIYSEETSGIWRNVAASAARPVITTFTVDPRVFDDILKKADQVAYSTDIGTGVCDGDLTIFVREVAREVEYRRKMEPRSPFRKDRFHLTDEGIRVLAEIDAVSDSLGLVGVTELGKARREVLGCPAPDFKGTPDEARQRLAAWKDKQDSTSRIVGDKPTVAPLALPVPVEKTVRVEDKPVVFDGPEDYAQSIADIGEAEAEADAIEFVSPATTELAKEALDSAPVAKPFVWDEKARGAFFGKVNPLMKAAGIPDEVQDEFRHAAMGGSLKTFTGTPEQGQKMIEGAIAERNKTKMAEDKAHRARAMSLICPSGNGSIVFQGVRYMRQAQEIADPADLTLGLQAWAAWWESVKSLGIAPHDSCVVRAAAPATTRKDAPETAPQQTAPAYGSINVERMKIVRVVKSFDEKSSKVILSLYKPTGEFPEFRERVKEGARNAWPSVSRATGIDWDKAEMGHTWHGEMTVLWAPSENKSAKGNPYKDFMGVEGQSL